MFPAVKRFPASQEYRLVCAAGSHTAACVHGADAQRKCTVRRAASASRRVPSILQPDCALACKLAGDGRRIERKIVLRQHLVSSASARSGHPLSEATRSLLAARLVSSAERGERDPDKLKADLEDLLRRSWGA